MSKNKTTQSPKALLTGAVVGGILTMLPAAHAQYANDSFLTGATPANGEYSVGAIQTQSPTVAGFTGDWSTTGGSGNVQASSLSYAASGYAAPTGGSLSLNDWNRVGRLFDSSVASSFSTSSSGTLYLSFLMQSAGAGNGYQSLELYGGGWNDGTQRAFQLGAGGWGDFNGGQFGFKQNSAGPISDLGAVNPGVNLFLVRFDLGTGAGADSVTAWMNPTLTGFGDPTGGVTVSGLDLRSVDRVSFATFGGGANLDGDEIRLGSTLTSVTAVPEPTSLSLLGLGAIGILAIRRKQA